MIALIKILFEYGNQCTVHFETDPDLTTTHVQESKSYRTQERRRRSGSTFEHHNSAIKSDKPSSRVETTSLAFLCGISLLLRNFSRAVGKMCTYRLSSLNIHHEAIVRTSIDMTSLLKKRS
jgi:hypothetical protein